MACEFDTFHKEEKGVLKGAIDKVFRKSMTERLNLTLQECKTVNGKKILDVGCGSGRLSIELHACSAKKIGFGKVSSKSE